MSVARAAEQAPQPITDAQNASHDTDTDSDFSVITDSDAGSDGADHSSRTTDPEGKVEKSSKKSSFNKQIFEGYRRLLSRRVDLVGDYAGDESFLIDGDSLLLRCFDDERLDFHTGCQLLHATYNVENFLQQLVQRKCQFSIVFFDSNKENCVPPGTAKADIGKFFLARAAIIHHLTSKLTRTHPSIHVDIFSTWHSPEFIKYLQKTAPYFVMAHDGAAAVDRSSTESMIHDRKRKQTVEQKALRSMILYFIARGYNVALINGLEWRDTKVMTMVLEVRTNDRQTLDSKVQKAIAATVPNDPLKPALALPESEGLSARQALAVATVSELLRDQSLSQIPAATQTRFSVLYLLHIVLLEHIPLASRRFALDTTDKVDLEHGIQYLQHAARTSALALTHSDKTLQGLTGNVVDLLDGRLFLQLVNSKFALDDSVQTELQALLDKVEALVDAASPAAAVQPATEHQYDHTGEASVNDIKVLPFSNRVFDKHLESVHIRIDAEASNEKSLASRKIFQEVTHWHNAKRPLIKKTQPTPQDERKAKRLAKREQLFMAEMRTYAASLTNAVGRSLEPETIIVGVSRRQHSTALSSAADSEASDSSASGKSKTSGKKPGGGKNASKNAGKQAMLNNIAAAKAKKDESASDKVLASWKVVCKGFEADSDPRARYRKAKEFRNSMQAAWREILDSEVELYQINSLLHFWIDICRRNEQKQNVAVTALIWSHVWNVTRADQLPKSIGQALDLTVATLGLPAIAPKPADAAVDRKLAFDFVLPTKAANLSVNIPSRDFQLLECGPYLERDFDSRPDPRVDFQPDAWQRKVLDSIDAGQSTFVVAPTSAGKTFISFHAMRRVLEADDEGILVYVAPTKALVNQIAAEIQARYSKRFKYGGHSVWAIHTRDHRINNPTGCQVLVTVPHVLQIMLLAPTNANSWSNRVRRIIFDEVHSIGQAEDGVVWEQLLLMAPCPIIALSATVGNPDEFSDWLRSTQEAIGNELVTVQHPYRYSHLRKYYYVPPETVNFTGIPQKRAFGILGLEGLPGFNHVHPVAALEDKSRGIPEDLALEPRDCLHLWQAMVKVQSKTHTVPSQLDPAKALPEVARNVDILKWEKELKKLLQAWLEDQASPYDNLLAALEQNFRNDSRERGYTTSKEDDEVSAQTLDDPYQIRDTTLPLLCRLHEQDALPAILFNYDRSECERICSTVLATLESAEQAQRKTGPRWTKTLQRWEEWKDLKEKASSKAAKSTVKKPKKGKDDDGDDKVSKLDLQKDSAGGDDTKWESFDPDAPLEGYHFADYTKVQMSEVSKAVGQLRYRDVPEFLIQALLRGIGVHHAGMNRKYRQVVEILFRQGFLRVVIATGTLALGINMPCKTVVFSGDSVFLTALNYRQCAGRAGRRGFDLLGNVVFQGVSRQKVCRLISSRLPDLNGHFPITTTLVLRLFTLLTDSKYAKSAVSAINALLTQPRLYMGGPSFKDQTMHHLRFSIEYLRRQQLLGSDGAPLNFAGLVSHLYFTENSSFAFHALLKEGYFHELCADIKGNEKGTLETLMLVMAHLFNRVYCRQADAEYIRKVVKPSSSIVFLPPLPAAAAKVLKEHNQQTLKVYRSYVETFVEQHIAHADDKLPLTGLQFTEAGKQNAGGIKGLPPTKIRSPFVALSGAGDDFDSVHDLCATARHGVFLEEAVIPSMPVYPDEMAVPLNAWLLDFYKHGDVFTLEKSNGIRRADVWFFLNDFSLVLATIIASLMNFMKLTPGDGDMDMLDVMGNLDAHEEQEDDRVAASETQSTTSTAPSAADSGVGLAERPKPVASAAVTAANKKKAKNEDSWEDAADAEEELADLRKRETANLAEEAKASETTAAWEGGEGGEGLKNVLKAFQKLHYEFNVKFRAMWA